MTIPFGGRRLILTFRITPADPSKWERDIPLGVDDQELARLSRRSKELDSDLERWKGLTLIYGR